METGKYKADIKVSIYGGPWDDVEGVRLVFDYGIDIDYKSYGIRSISHDLPSSLKVEFHYTLNGKEDEGVLEVPTSNIDFEELRESASSGFWFEELELYLKDDGSLRSATMYCVGFGR